MVQSCTEKSDNSPLPIEEEEAAIAPPVLFTVIGDVPYNETQRIALNSIVSDHNAKSQSEFIIHVGDIKPGSEPCNEQVYVDVSSMLEKFEVPTFIILGDNEFNDCENPEEGLQFWNDYFFHFNEKWQFAHAVAYQEERAENFTWTENEILFIGINLVGSRVHDADEWSTRLSHNAHWVAQLLEDNKNNTKAAVIFAHANIVNFGTAKFRAFTDVFRASAAEYAQPVLFLHGDGHNWIQDRPWTEQNILRVQINGGGEAVQVTVDTAKENTFSFDTQFLD